jgi:TrmH family RNA methyltransferase
LKKGWQNYIHLLTKRGRSKERKFIVEGVRLCEEALLSDWKIETVFINEDFQSDSNWADFNRKLVNKKIPFTVLKKSNFKKLADTEHTQGIAFIVNIPDIKIDDLPLNQFDLLVILDGIRDPGNIGTIIRSADWFGANAVVLSEDCVNPYNPKVVRSTMGSIFNVPVLEIKERKQFLAKLKKKNFFIIATSVSAKMDLEKIRVKKPVALILGGEVQGISPDLQRRADALVKIHKFGKAESLNVAQAGAVTLHYISNQLFNKRK